MLSYKILLLIFCICLNWSSFGQDQINIINGNKIGKALISPKKWSRGGNYICVSGPGLLVASRLSVSAPFVIKARISLDKLKGTAASVMIDGNYFGLDGKDKEIFIEGRDFGFKKLALTEKYIKPGKAFDLQIKYNSRTISFFINGKLVANESYRGHKEHIIALRPHRAVMKIFSFSVTGKTVKTLSVDDIFARKNWGTADCFDINAKNRLVFELPGSFNGKFGGNVNIKLSTPDGHRHKIIKSPCKYDGKLKTLAVEFRPGVLSGFYNSSIGKFNAVTGLAVLQTKVGNITKRVVVFDKGNQTYFPAGRVAKHNGSSFLEVDSKILGVMSGFLAAAHGRLRPATLRGFDAAGLNIAWLMVKPHEYYSKNRQFNMKLFNDSLKAEIVEIVKNAPSAYIMLDWKLFVSAGWAKSNPGELMKFDRKITSLKNSPKNSIQPSYASRLWRRETLDIILSTLEFIKKTPFADRLAGIKLGYANAGEWNGWGYHEKVFGDFSQPMQKAYTNWLRKKYGSITELNDSWGAHYSSYKNSFVATVNDRIGNKHGGMRVFPDGKSAVDYYSFLQEYTVETINYFAKAVKKYSKQRLLVGAYYGYFTGHLSGGSYHFQDSGHYATDKFLQSPYLDYAAGPSPYENRLLNATANNIFSSFALNNKVALIEEDLRTHHSGDSNRLFGTTSGMAESLAILQRDFIANLTRGTSFYFYDFIKGWYEDTEFMNMIKRLKYIDDFAMKINNRNVSQIAIIVDEKIIPYFSNHANSLTRGLQKMLLHELDIAGAPWNLYLMSDLDKIDLSNIKFVLFANSYILNKEQLQIIRQKYFNSGRTVAFLYNPGLYTGEFKKDISNSNISGIKLKRISNKRLDCRSKSGAPLNTYYKYVYLWSIDDKTVNTLGKSGNMVIAGEKNFKGYKTVFISATGLNSRWLRMLYKRSGVNIYFHEDANLYATSSFLGITASGRNKTVFLPKKVEVVYDLIAGKEVARNCNSFEVSFNSPKSTRIFFTGKKDCINGF